MFTGIIEEIGTVDALSPRGDEVELRIKCRHCLKGLSLGDSIAVDGICLTVTSRNDESFSAFASTETMRCTSLGSRKVGDKVNLEPPLSLEKKLGGHMVQGHVDGVGAVVSVTPEGDSQMWKFSLPRELGKLLVSKGSVAVDGISLTVVEAKPEYFTIAIIPRTLEETTLQCKKPGDPVNIETDIIGKYVFKYLHPDES